jgi:hypothetical protein
MKDPHESEKYLVRWVKVKVEDLGQRCDAFIDDDATYALVTEFEHETPKQIRKIVLQKPIPWDLRGIASDAIKNIRDALDQTCLHCTERLNSFFGRHRKGKGTHFPFGENPVDFDNVLLGVSGRQSKDIAPELHPVLQSFQPYPTGEGHVGGNDRLRHIGRVSGPNKHELTLQVGFTADAFHFGRVFNPGGFWYSLFPPAWDATKNETKVAECHVDSHIDLDLQFASFIAFDHPLIGRYPCHLVLKQWTVIVEDIIARLIAETDVIVGV